MAIDPGTDLSKVSGVVIKTEPGGLGVIPEGVLVLVKKGSVKLVDGDRYEFTAQLPAEAVASLYQTPRDRLGR